MHLDLYEKEHLIDNVWSFRFNSPEPLSYQAGQFVYVELPHENQDEEGPKRWFTNSAAPYENIIQITTRITSSTFKQALTNLEPGSTLMELIEKPAGDFIWQDSDLPTVFIAGGIGITPYHSILKQRIYESLPLKLTLLYANRSKAIPFKDELDGWADNDPSLKVFYVTGAPLTLKHIAELIPGLNRSLVYLSGPEPMVEALGDGLKTAGLAATQLKQDFFPNYNETNY